MTPKARARGDVPAAAHLGDKAKVDQDAHGCPACRIRESVRQVKNPKGSLKIEIWAASADPAQASEEVLHLTLRGERRRDAALQRF